MKLTKCIVIILSLVLSSLNIQGATDNDVVLVTGQYYTPDQFGAKGDGKSDDTRALREALYRSSIDGKILFIPAKKNYYVTASLNFYKGKYQSYSLNIVGCIPVKKESYTPQIYGGISVEKGVEIFKNANFSGSIQRVCIVGKRDVSVHMFDNCVCDGLVITGCNISNFGVIFFDTSVRGVSQITYNSFLTAFYFSKNDKTSSGFIDSTIAFNYINGGVELNDNVCFEWGYYNGSSVNNNFIDYYRTIYQPRAISPQAFEGPTSSNNQYQVFRYLYAKGQNISTILFHSFSDTFNWTNPFTLKKLSDYVPLYYSGNDGKKYAYPPYIAICHSAWKTNIISGKLERNIGPVVFIDSGLTEYEDNVFDVEFNSSTDIKSPINYRLGNRQYYNGGKYLKNKINIRGIIETIDHLPDIRIGWSSSPNGRRVQIGDKTFVTSNIFENGKWKAVWNEE